MSMTAGVKYTPPKVSCPTAALTPEKPAGRASATVAVMLTGRVDNLVVEELAVCTIASRPAKTVAAKLATQTQPHNLLLRRTVKIELPTSHRKWRFFKLCPWSASTHHD